MIKILPFVLIPLFLIGGLTYFRFVYLPLKSLESPKSSVGQTDPVEVPKSLPGATNEDRINTLEKSIDSLVKEINSLKSSFSSKTGSTDTGSLDSLEGSIVDLKARISALEKATPAPVVASSKSTIYIPLGSGGQINGNTDWNSLNTFQATVDTAQYAGYKNMQLEVNMRLVQPGGILYARLSSGSVIDSSQVSATSTSSALYTSSAFTLSSGSKTYTLQAKSSDGSQAFIDNARIKVSF